MANNYIIYHNISFGRTQPRHLKLYAKKFKFKLVLQVFCFKSKYQGLPAKLPILLSDLFKYYRKLICVNFTSYSWEFNHRQILRQYLLKRNSLKNAWKFAFNGINKQASRLHFSNMVIVYFHPELNIHPYVFFTFFTDFKKRADYQIRQKCF